MRKFLETETFFVPYLGKNRRNKKRSEAFYFSHSNFPYIQRRKRDRSKSLGFPRFYDVYISSWPTTVFTRYFWDGKDALPENRMFRQFNSYYVFPLLFFWIALFVARASCLYMQADVASFASPKTRWYDLFFSFVYCKRSICKRIFGVMFLGR